MFCWNIYYSLLHPFFSILYPFGNNRGLIIYVCFYLLAENPYDSIPNFSAADALRLTGIGRNEFIDIMNKCRSKVLDLCLYVIYGKSNCDQVCKFIILV